MGQILELGYGSCNFSNTAAKVAVMKVEPPFKRSLAATSGAARGSSTRHNAGTLDLHGFLVNQRSEHENGTILLVQVGWTRNGSPIREGALFLRLRAGAPQYRVMAKLPTNAENRYGDRFMAFTGFADIMNSADLVVSGLQVNRTYTDRYMSEEEMDECLEISQLSAETMPRPSLSAVATPEGLQMREIAQTPNRRLRLGRRA
jgi:hypothetical protein